MLSLKCAETKPASPSCPVISLALYTQVEVWKILTLKVYNGSHCYFKSPTFPKSSCSAKLERYRCLKEKIILSFPCTSWLPFLTTFQGNIVFQISHRKNRTPPRLLRLLSQVVCGCYCSLKGAEQWGHADWPSMKKYQLRLTCIYRGGFGLRGRPLRKWSK